jgi:hypothetical protein
LNKFSYKIGLLWGGAFAEHAQTKTSHSSVVVRTLKLGFKSRVPDHLWLIHAAPMTSGLRGLAWIATVHWEDVSNRTTSTYTACAGKCTVWKYCDKKLKRT